jgi:Ca-activated chloride channel homolog
MFRFEHIEHLYALALAPALILLFAFAWRRRKQAMRRFANEKLLGRLMPEMSRYKDTAKFILILLALCALIIGWANPQWGTKKEKVTRKSIDVFIALDISRSMDVQDISPSRLERAKRFAQNLARELRGERIGTIIFAGNAYLQTPLTTDYAAVELFIKSANTGMAPTQGTAIVEAIDLAERSFEEDNKNHKALIVISDGENHDSEALDRARKARSNGLLIFSVGVGSAEGGFIPVTIAGRTDYKRDQTGNPVRSKLDEEVLRRLAQAGDGAYFNLGMSGEQVSAALRERLDAIEKREFEQRVFSDYESYFQYFIALALFLIVVEFVISYRKGRYLGDKDLFQI